MAKWQQPAAWERAPLLAGIYLYTPYHEPFIAQLKASVPADMRQWDGDEKRWYIFESWAETALALARQVWPQLTERHVSSGNQGQWRGDYRQRHAGSDYAGRMFSEMASASSDHATLYVTADAPPEVIRAAYKALMLLAHPDKGGSLAKAQAINAAYDNLKKGGKA